LPVPSALTIIHIWDMQWSTWYCGVCNSLLARHASFDISHTNYWLWCGLRPSVLGQDQSETKKNWSWSCTLGLGLTGLVLCCETWSCHAHRHNDLEGHSNFSSTIYSFSILCLEHHYCGDQQWRSLT